MHPGDAGFDLRCCEDFSLAAGDRMAVPTGIAVAIPEGHCGLVLPRSGLAARHGISVVNTPGLIDSGYRGEVRILLINHGDEDVAFEAGDRVAQLIVSPIPDIALVAVEQLGDTARGAGGLGSTGRR
ncbi:MAG: dUTP diphosphatase [Acidimicrobiia bacterium]|nr:dUTP diphosphatase [Acidimicrobiia bacterium]